MKWMLIFWVLIPFCASAAVTPRLKTDTALRPLLRQQDFIQQYGTDDSSKALIRYYFFRARHYRRFIWLPFLFAIPLAGSAVYLFANPPLNEDGKDLKLLGILFLFTASLSLTFMWSVFNVIRFHHFRSRLTASLRLFRETGKIANRIAESSLFRVCLRGEPALLHWRKPQPSLIAMPR